jgi:hypothetical protein
MTLEWNMTKKGKGTEMMKMFTVVRNFLEDYFKAARNDKFYRPSFADNPRSLWFGLSESERESVLDMARRGDKASLDRMLSKMDEEEDEKDIAAKRDELFKM